MELLLDAKAMSAEIARLVVDESYTGDVYRQAAANLLGIPFERVTTEQRQRVKTMAWRSFFFAERDALP